MALWPRYPVPRREQVRVAASKVVTPASVFPVRIKSGYKDFAQEAVHRASRW